MSFLLTHLQFELQQLRTEETHMKTSIVKAFVLFTLALSLLFVGASAINTVDTSVSVCYDGPEDNMVVK